MPLPALLNHTATSVILRPFSPDHLRPLRSQSLLHKDLPPEIPNLPHILKPQIPKPVYSCHHSHLEGSCIPFSVQQRPWWVTCPDTQTPSHNLNLSFSNLRKTLEKSLQRFHGSFQTGAALYWNEELFACYTGHHISLASHLIPVLF